MDISSFPCTQLVFAFSLGWTLKEVNINGDFNQYIWAFSLGWTQETDVRVTSSSLLISSGKPEEVFPTNIFSVLNECPPLSTEPKLFNTIPTQFLLSHFYPHWFSTEPYIPLSFPFLQGVSQGERLRLIDAVCHYFRIKPQDIITSSRKQNLVQARQLTVYLTQKHTNMSSCQIGARIRRDHSTVLHSCNQVTNRLQTDKSFKRILEDIEKTLLA